MGRANNNTTNTPLDLVLLWHVMQATTEFLSRSAIERDMQHARLSVTCCYRLKTNGTIMQFLMTGSTRYLVT